MNSNSLYAYRYYLDRGYSPQAAAGIAGNLQVESGFADDVITGQRRGDQGTAFGAAQWRGPRLDGLKSYAENQGLDYRSLDAQLGYVDHEMRTGSDAGAGQAFAKLQNAQSPSEAAAAFMHHYERPNADPSINHIAKRQDYANSLFGADPNAVASAQASPVNLTSASPDGIASLAPQAAGALPTIQEAQAADPMSGMFSLLLQNRMAEAAPPPVAAEPMRRQADVRSPDEKLAAVSQTPNVYIDRLRKQYG